MQHDLDHLRIVVAGILDRLDIGVGDMPARLDELDGKADRRVGLGVGRMAVAVGRDLGVGEFREVLAEIGCADRQ